MLAGLFGSFLSVQTGLAQSISQAYATDGNVQKGMLVMIDPKDSKKVQPLSNKKDVAMQGVAVAAKIPRFSSSSSTRSLSVPGSVRWMLLGRR